MAKFSFVAKVTFNHPLIHQKCDTMMNVSTQDIVHFYIWLFPNVSNMAFSHYYNYNLGL